MTGHAPTPQENHPTPQVQPPPKDSTPTHKAQSQDHSTLVDALKQAFGKKDDPTEVKLGMDETIIGGKYMVRDQLVNANGEPIDEKGKKLKKEEE